MRLSRHRRARLSRHRYTTPVILHPYCALTKNPGQTKYGDEHAAYVAQIERQTIPPSCVTCLSSIIMHRHLAIYCEMCPSFIYSSKLLACIEKLYGFDCLPERKAPALLLTVLAKHGRDPPEKQTLRTSLIHNHASHLS